MNCSDCMDKLDSYVDRELDEEDMRQVRLHLELCPPCEHVFNLRADLKRLVKVACDDDIKANPALRDKVRQLLS
jgi:mycothiol system anti-sigma-R factor